MIFASHAAMISAGASASPHTVGPHSYVARYVNWVGGEVRYGMKPLHSGATRRTKDVNNWAGWQAGIKWGCDYTTIL